MANNPYVNKVQFGNETLIDISGDTVAANKMLSGITAHDKSGASVTGSIPIKTSSDFTWEEIADTNIEKVFVECQVPAGYYSSNTYSGVSKIYMPIPSTGSVVFTVCIPNGTTTPSKTNLSDWIPLEIEVDSNGNSNITDNTVPAAGVSF